MWSQSSPLNNNKWFGSKGNFSESVKLHRKQHMPVSTWMNQKQVTTQSGKLAEYRDVANIALNHDVVENGGLNVVEFRDI